MIERYRLILKHEYIDDYGNSYKIDEPYIIDNVSLTTGGYEYPPLIRVDEMMDRLKHLLLIRLSDEGGNLK